MAPRSVTWGPVFGCIGRCEVEGAGILPPVVRPRGNGLSGRDIARRVHRPFFGRIHRIRTWEVVPGFVEAANIAARLSRVND